MKMKVLFSCVILALSIVQASGGKAQKWKWNIIELHKDILWNLESKPLEIKTSTDEMVYVTFYKPGSNDLLTLLWNSDNQITLNGCTPYHKETMTNVPSTAKKVWRIVKTTDELKLYCNCKLVYKKKFTDCVTPHGKDFWAGPISHMKFSSYNKGAEAYRAARKGKKC